jgi:hypothetical protein
MTRNPDTDRNTRSDKAAALFTLAAETAGVRGSCLSDEQLAMLVEGRSGSRELAELWNHLGGCDRCYEVWFSLKKGLKEEAPHGRLYRLSRFKKISYIGTALAAAASIAVYLNVVRMDVAEQKAAPPTIHLQDKNLASPQQLPLSVRKEKAEPSEPAKMAEQAPAVLPPAARTTVGAASKGRVEPVPQATRQSTEKPQPREERQKAVPAPLPVERKSAKSVARDAALPLAESEMAPAAVPPVEELGGWLEELRSACLSGRQDPQFWNEMTARGVRLEARQVGGLASTQGGRLETVLALMQAMRGPDTVPQQCRLILAELAKEGGSW